jgi:uncharacterized protein YjiS (DUF1127 family)
MPFFPFTGNSLRLFATYAESACVVCGKPACRGSRASLPAIHDTGQIRPRTQGRNAMAILDLSRAVDRNGPISDAISRFVYMVVSSVISWNDARKTYKALSQLTAHELDDIGLCRGDLDSISRK